jgi:hypothetical protein
LPLTLLIITLVACVKSVAGCTHRSATCYAQALCDQGQVDARDGCRPTIHNFNSRSGSPPRLLYSANPSRPVMPPCASPMLRRCSGGGIRR